MTHHSAKQDDSDCAGDHNRIAVQLSVSRSCELQLQEEELNLDNKLGDPSRGSGCKVGQDKEHKPCCKQEQWTRRLSSVQPTILQSIEGFS